MFTAPTAKSNTNSTTGTALSSASTTLRLVSDSAIRRAAVDPDGNLVIYAWSDGGNSVMYREPFDVRTHAKGFQGLGMSAYGAGRVVVRLRH